MCIVICFQSKILVIIKTQCQYGLCLFENTKWCTYILKNHKVDVEKHKDYNKNIRIIISQLQNKQTNYVDLATKEYFSHWSKRWSQKISDLSTRRIRAPVLSKPWRNPCETQQTGCHDNRPWSKCKRPVDIHQLHSGVPASCPWQLGQLKVFQSLLDRLQYKQHSDLFTFC